jgi:hypothetical protein
MGYSEVTLRLPSAISGIFSIAGIFLLGRRLYSYNEGLIAAVLLAVLWFPIYYSQEARSYAMLLLFTLITTFLWITLLNSQKKNVLGLSVYVLAAIMTAYLHYYGLYLVLLQGVTTALLAICRDQPAARRALPLYSLVALVYIPWLPGMWRQILFSERGDWIPHPQAIHTTLLTYLYHLFNKRWQQAHAVAFTLVFTLGKHLYDTWKRNVSKQSNWSLPVSPTLFLTAWIVIPFVLVYALSVTWVPILTYRNLIILLPPVYILLARAVATLTTHNGKLVAIFLIATIFVHQIVGGDYYQTPSKTQFREAAAFIAEQETVYQDSMIVGQFAYPFLLDHYLASNGTMQRVDLIIEKDRICLGQIYRETNSLDLPVCPTVSGDFAYQLEAKALREPKKGSTLQSPAREPNAREFARLIDDRDPSFIWFVHGRGALAIDPENLPGFELIGRRDFVGVNVYLLANRKQASLTQPAPAPSKSNGAYVSNTCPSTSSISQLVWPHSTGEPSRAKKVTAATR